MSDEKLTCRSSGKTPIRYPGGKQRFLPQILRLLPQPGLVQGRLIEPFVGGGSVFFAFGRRRALLADINSELIDIYKGIKNDAKGVWREFKGFPSDRSGYYKVRECDTEDWSLTKRAARTLYLNRTCFKGMWRHNSSGRFNVGYGGEERRHVVTRKTLLQVAAALRDTSLRCSDFERTIDIAGPDDFLFLDPPYKPGMQEMQAGHYLHAQFTLRDHKRLAACLDRATGRGVRWLLTTSAHPSIVALFPGHSVLAFDAGVGGMPGVTTKKAREAIIFNYNEAS